MIRTLRPEFPSISIHRMAQALEVPRSLVYRSSLRKSRPDLLLGIEKLVTVFLGYGYRRVFRSLREHGFACSEHEVRKTMREHGLMARRPRSKGVTRASLRDLRAANLIKGLKAARIDEVWVADTTLIRAASGKVYLACLEDLHSRKIVAWHVSRSNDEELVRICLDKALQKRRPAAGWIHHSDQGSTYTASGYVRRIRDMGGRVSLSRPGKPRDNAHMESFFRTLKLEEADRNRYNSFLEVHSAMKTYIEGIYNSTRMHSSLGYASPDQFETRLAGEAQ